MPRFLLGLATIALISASAVAQASVDPDICNNASSQNAAPFADGDGSAEAPYVICTAAQWAAFASDATVLDAHVALRQNIRLAPRTARMVGSEDAPFTGHFDGGGYRVNTNLPEERHELAEKARGLFAATDGASIRDLLTVIYANGGEFPLGGVVGVARNSTLSGLHTTVTMQHTRSVGGVVGLMIGGSLADSSAMVTVHSVDSEPTVGGLVAELIGASVVRSGARVNLVQSEDLPSNAWITAVGGVAGIARNATIRDVRVAGTLDFSVDADPRDTKVGGIVGRVHNVVIERALFAGHLAVSGEASVGRVERNGALTMNHVYTTQNQTAPRRNAVYLENARGRSEWLARGFKTSAWRLRTNRAPLLRSSN